MNSPLYLAKKLRQDVLVLGSILGGKSIEKTRESSLWFGGNSSFGIFIQVKTWICICLCCWKQFCLLEVNELSCRETLSCSSSLLPAAWLCQPKAEPELLPPQLCCIRSENKETVLPESRIYEGDRRGKRKRRSRIMSQEKYTNLFDIARNEAI